MSACDGAGYNGKYLVMTQKILVIDDEPEVRFILKLLLEQAGYQVVIAADGKEGLARVRRDCPDLVLLDITMPVMDGWKVCRLLREATDVPIIMLTVLGEKEQIAEGLYLGADDYVVKPWSNQELLARIRAVLRRSKGSLPRRGLYLRPCEGLVIDSLEKVVIVEGRKVSLTPIEFRLLTCLARRPGELVSHSEMIEYAWGKGGKGRALGLRVHMLKLRKKIEEDPRQPRYLLNRYGEGYCLSG